MAARTDETGAPAGRGLCDAYIDDPPPFQNEDCEEFVNGWSARSNRTVSAASTSPSRVGVLRAAFLIDDASRHTTSVLCGNWLVPARPRLDDLDEATRGALARSWADDGRAEHALVAAFARLVLQLLALGAPAELVAGAQAALADGVEHARLCYGLASVYAGEPLGPGPLAMHGALEDAGDLTSTALTALYEGCIGETLAAIEAQIAGEQARDPVMAVILKDHVATPMPQGPESPRPWMAGPRAGGLMAAG